MTDNMVLRHTTFRKILTMKVEKIRNKQLEEVSK
jgi:hypothetical protein